MLDQRKTYGLVPGFGGLQPKWQGQVLEALQADEGSRVFPIDVDPGDCRREAFMALIEGDEFQDAGLRMGIFHSAGNLALSGTMTRSDVLHLAEHVDGLVLANPPYDSQLSTAKLLTRFAANSLLYMKQQNMKDVAHDVRLLMQWCFGRGNLLREIRNIRDNTLHHNIKQLMETFGPRMRIVVDPYTDPLCPPQELIQVVTELCEETPPIDELPGHAPYLPDHKPFVKKLLEFAGTLRRTRNLPKAV